MQRFSSQASKLTMNTRKFPIHQQILIGLAGILAGIAFWGTILDAFKDAYEVVTPLMALLGTIAATIYWIAAKKGRLKWAPTGGQRVTVLDLGLLPSLAIVGLLVLLWTPQIVRLLRFWPTRANAEKAFAEGMMYLGSYDLIKAERNFCRAAKIDPKFLRARLYLARTWRDLGYDGAAAGEAQRIVDMANDMRADPSEVKLYEAFRAETDGQWEEAKEKYRALWDEKGIQAFDVLALVHALNLAGQNRLALETIDEVRTRFKQEKGEVKPLDDIRLKLERSIALMKNESSEELAAALEAKAAIRNLKGAEREIDRTYLLARAQFLECDALSRMGADYKPACEAALAVFQRQDNSVDVAKVHQALGHNAAKPQDRLLHYLKALKIYRAIGFQRGISDVRVNIAILVSENRREHEGALICGAALAAASQIASLNLPDIRLNCSYYVKVLGRDFEGAQREAEEVLEMARQQGNKRLEAAALIDTAYVAHASKLHTEALQLYKDGMAISSELQDEPSEDQETTLLYAWLLSDAGRHLDARSQLEGVLKSYSKSYSWIERKQIVADIVCWDRKILGSGTAEWRQMLKSSTGFTPKLCVREQIAPLGNLDSALWSKVEVKNPHCRIGSAKGRVEDGHATAFSWVNRSCYFAWQR
jgi:hypothetical protein